MLVQYPAHYHGFGDCHQGLRFETPLKIDFTMNKSGSSSRPAQSKLGTITFLLIDDEHGILSCIALLLEARGYQVFTAGSVAAAIQVLEQEANAIDCLIIDFSTPGTNGLQLHNRFRSMGWRHPTILCSSLKMDIDDHPDVQYWPDYILAKPYCLDRLQDAISIATRNSD